MITVGYNTINPGLGETTDDLKQQQSCMFLHYFSHYFMLIQKNRKYYSMSSFTKNNKETLKVNFCCFT